MYSFYCRIIAVERKSRISSLQRPRRGKRVSFSVDLAGVFYITGALVSLRDKFRPPSAGVFRADGVFSLAPLANLENSAFSPIKKSTRRCIYHNIWFQTSKIYSFYALRLIISSFFFLTNSSATNKIVTLNFAPVCDMRPWRGHNSLRHCFGVVLL